MVVGAVAYDSARRLDRFIGLLQDSLCAHAWNVRRSFEHTLEHSTAGAYNGTRDLTRHAVSQLVASHTMRVRIIGS